MATVTSRTSRRQDAKNGKATVETVVNAEESVQSVDDLRALLAAQQAQIAALAEQHAQMVTTIQQLSQPMETPIEIVEADGAATDATDATNGAPVARKSTSRRGLLKWGGLGAAAALAAAAGTAGLSRTTAHAASGDNMVLGDAFQFAENTTALLYNGTETTPIALVVGIASNDNSQAINAQAGNASSGPAYGVYGAAGTGGQAYGIYGAAGTTGNGVYGQSTGASSYGVWGHSDSGYGVVANSSTGIDIWAVGTGRFLQTPSGFTGAPTSGSYNQGEQIRDDIGDLYICVAGGSPGTWRRVAAGTPGQSGSFNFLPEPIRLLDTRTSSPWLAGSQHTLQVTGVVVDSISVPAGSVGVVGNVAVVGPSGGGDLRLFPGPALPPTSSINFAAGQIIANGVTVRFNSSGQIQIKVDMPGGTKTNVLFDAVGYIL